VPSKHLEIAQSLSLTEMAALELTNDPYVSVRRGRPTRRAILTSKSAYSWAALLAFVAKSPQVAPEQLEVAVGAFLQRWLEFEEYEADSQPPFLARDIGDLHGVLQELAIADDEELAGSFAEEGRLAYQSLIKRKLIEDPATVAIAGFSLAVLGLVPTSFTCKTRDGRLVSRKISALYWSYEQSEKAGVVSTTVEFRLLKLVRAFWGAFSVLMEKGEK
jgi:hypothetical protein